MLASSATPDLYAQAALLSKDVKVLANEESTLLVLGMSGSGKSTLISKMLDKSKTRGYYICIKKARTPTLTDHSKMKRQLLHALWSIRSQESPNSSRTLKRLPTYGSSVTTINSVYVMAYAYI